jgi:Ca-activated chloride channel family protein
MNTCQTMNPHVRNISQAQSRLRQSATAILPALMFLFLFPAISLPAQEMRITQVDSSGLLVRGTLDLYLSGSFLPGGLSEAELMDSLKVTDRDGGDLELLSVEARAARDEGISFLLLLDNSGSMYDEERGGVRRIDEAAEAVARFIAVAGSGPDRLGLGFFNTRLEIPLAPGADPRELSRQLEGLERPPREEAYTELYLSVVDALDELRGTPGRRAVIVLSDGRNLSYADFEGGPSPVWGEARMDADQVARAYLDAGVTLYGIHVADDQDPELANIALATGGRIFDARETGDLSALYQSIREEILNEIKLSVRGPAINRPDREIMVSLGRAQAAREYAVPMIFGSAAGDMEPDWLLPLIFGLTSLLGAALLYALRMESAASSAELSNLDSGATVVLGTDVTTIGSDRAADFTIAGNPGLEGEHATVIRGDDGTFTLVARGKLRVNNRPVKKATLEPGDVIRMEGSTVVFDAPESPKGLRRGREERGE